MPIGFKNSTEGDLQGAVDAVSVASVAQVFPGITGQGQAAVLSTRGNPDCHVVLRGSSSGANYDVASVEDVLSRLTAAGLARRVIIDASHGNSGKDHRRQPEVLAEVSRRIGAGDRDIVGVMLESFLEGGRQELVFGRAEALVYGQSITDACIDWTTTERVLESAAGAVRARRAVTREG
jgi:3-deoxy-7-phosphoheptulonate synthase